MDKLQGWAERGGTSILSTVSGVTVSAATELGYFNVVSYGAKGDGATDDTTFIQAAIDDCEAVPGGVVFFPATALGYKITAPLTVTQSFITIKGATPAIVINTGTGAAFIVTAEYTSFEDMDIRGNGGMYGAGATTTYGIEFSTARHCSLHRCKIMYHGSHGVYFHGGAWSDSIINCLIWFNAGDGVHSVSPSGLEQNGNALSILNTTLAYCGGSGIEWAASGLNINGCTLEGNLGSGVLIKTLGTTLAASAVNITGNYFEANKYGQVKLWGIAGFPVTGVIIEGNYMYSPLLVGDTALIIYGGLDAQSLSGIYIGINHYYAPGGFITHYVDLGNLDRYSTIECGYNDATNYQNLGTDNVAFSRGYKPADPPVLATGVPGRTIDEVITVLQTLGIVKQA